MQNGWKILLLVLLVLPAVCSQSIKVDYPQEVSVNEEFILSLELEDFEAGTYDVKIDVMENEKRIARIFSDELWKSTFYYLKKAITFGEEKEFKLKITQAFEKGNIVIKIKDSKGTVSTFEGYEIQKKKGVSESSLEQTQPEPQREEPVSFEATFTADEPNPNFQINQTAKENELEVIKLDAKDIKNNNPIQEDKTEIATKKYAGAGLLILCILLIFLLFLKKKKHGFEE